MYIAKQDGDQTRASVVITLNDGDVQNLVDETGFPQFSFGSLIYIDQLGGQVLIEFEVHNDNPPTDGYNPRSEALSPAERTPSLVGI